MENEHKRRIHYAGKYPKRFDEKYKELQPEKYTDIAEHIKSKGMTPAGTHVSIMVGEILDVLAIRPGERGADCTFGYGGHTEKMLEKLCGSGHITALDVDPIESEKSKKRLRDKGYPEEILSVELTNFRNIDRVAEQYGKFDFLLADLGVSSMQIDNPERGFTYKADGPLDLRLNPQAGVPAHERLQELSCEEIEDLLRENSDEPYAREIAREITARRRSGKPVTRTREMYEVISKALSSLPEKERKDAVKKSCARVFQALRIDINREFEALYELLEKLPAVMNPGGRIAVLTFHSGEDRLVKKSFKMHYQTGEYAAVSADAIRPSAEECTQNPRARSTKLRWAVLKNG